MLVVDHIKKYGLNSLKEQPYCIDMKEYPEEGLVTLNYNQIESDKFNPIVRECRGLILEMDTWNVVARSFDRFYNFNECPRTNEFKNKLEDAFVYEKVDGSLITAYWYKGKWRLATRKMAFAEGTSNYGEHTFNQLIISTGILERLWRFGDRESTYIFEFTSPESRVVKPYPDTELYLLTVRGVISGFEWGTENVLHAASLLGVKTPKTYSVRSIDELNSILKELPAVDEGYVCMWPDLESSSGYYRLKVKNPAYLAIAHLREGGALSLKRVRLLVVMNEYGEYLSYFPEDKKFFDPYIEAYNRIIDACHSLWNMVKDIETQKEFAIQVKDTPYAGIMFNRRNKGVGFEASIAAMTDNSLENLFTRNTNET